MQFESYEPAELATASIDQIAAFVLHSLEQEDIGVDCDDIMHDQVGHKLLKVVQQLISVWVFLFKMMQNYDVTSIQFNFEIEQPDLNTMIITSNAILYVPQDLYHHILKPYSHVRDQLLTYSLKNPASHQYALTTIYKDLSAKKNQMQQSFINFDKLDQLLKVAENDTLTKQSENFSFSEKHSEIRDDDEDESQLKYQSRLNKEK